MSDQLGLFATTEKGHAPLAHLLRPACLADYVGQKRVLQELARLMPRLPHLVLWGPPGTGKTTLAHIIAQELKLPLKSFNAVMSGVPELKALIREIKGLSELSGERCVLFIDEIHRFNKSQQDALLPYLEDGTFLFIGATTEYPQTSLNKALLSRVRTLALEALSEAEVLEILQRGLEHLQRPELVAHLSQIARFCDGDARRALGTLSLLSELKVEELADAQVLKGILQSARAYDSDQERHYDVISAFIKSIRGSDPDAALLWLAVMLDGGEAPEFIARRLMILASEDIGLANSQALQVATNAHYVTKNIGMPEARITLAHATVFMALSPKSNSAYLAIDKALEFVRENPTMPVPGYLKNTGPEKRHYKYPHSFPQHYVAQSYRPPEAELLRFFQAGTLGSEAAIAEIWRRSISNPS